LLDSWRTGIASFDNFDDLKVIGPTPDWYETLRPHLSERSRELIERRAKRATVLPRESRGRKDVIAGEIDRIEREWGLKP